ncbi:hypothetical protein SAMN02746065_11319 [Desulfocicer vacuolatum DSM 3385]|uniref:Uncharacterized protein n=1 Tax=Desulfocicer vacuolatum DSM 3385 TaxID=1121400 RepID=A0A1W2CPT7_9BACT|nr:hypothetical protein [Desulfocicer vacuolatum]SMC87277.1 hypothetical protein SAMN02746065_11319 [Desulfocicer vacuolatum DSM 3385]
MVNPEDLKLDDVQDFDPDGEIIELTQIVDEDESLDDVIELTEPIQDDDPSAPVIEKTVTGDEAVSHEQVCRALEKIIEEKYGHRMDALFSEVIEKVVTKEMDAIKNSLLKVLTEKTIPLG